MDEKRRIFHALVGELLDSVEPYGLAAAVLGELLTEVGELCRQLESFLDDLVTLDRARQPALPPALVRDFRRELRAVGSLSRHWQLGTLLSDATRQRCGMAAVPIIAAALCGVETWIDLTRDWLDRTERFRMRVDARAAGFSRDRPGLPDPELPRA